MIRTCGALTFVDVRNPQSVPAWLVADSRKAAGYFALEALILACTRVVSIFTFVMAALPVQIQRVEHRE